MRIGKIRISQGYHQRERETILERGSTKKVVAEDVKKKPKAGEIFRHHGHN